MNNQKVNFQRASRLPVRRRQLHLKYLHAKSVSHPICLEAVQNKVHKDPSSLLEFKLSFTANELVLLTQEEQGC